MGATFAFAQAPEQAKGRVVSGVPGTTPGPAGTPGTILDPFCAPGETLPPFVQPEGTRRMVAILARLREQAANGVVRNPFDSELRAQNLLAARDRSMAAGETLPPPEADLQLAVQLLQSGRSEHALSLFEQTEKRITSLGRRLDARSRQQLGIFTAVSHLRIGEQENCLTNHNSDSCLFPIQASGIHRQKRGSEGAIAFLLKHLESNPTDLQARWLLNVAFMTVGRFPAGVPEKWLIPPDLLKSDYDIHRFPDIADKVGLQIFGLAGGTVAEDFDADGYTDLMVSDWSLSGQLRLFRNTRDGRFVESTQASGLTGITGGLNMIQADFDNDGRVDVYLIRGAWLGEAGNHPDSLLRNLGNGRFEDVTEKAGLLAYHPSQAAVWFDYDRDGWIDLFVGNEAPENTTHPSQLFHNNRNGTFTECAALSGISINKFVKAVVAGDYNNDGLPDLFLSVRGEKNILLRNDGGTPAAASGQAPKWNFTDVTEDAGVAEPIFSFPGCFWDYDNDGFLDLFVSGYYIQNSGEIAAELLGLPRKAETPRLYRNLGNGRFENVTAAAGLDKVIHTMGFNFGDLDNDGWLDFYASTGDPDLATLIPNRMFRNSGSGRFVEVTESGGFGHLQKGHAVSFADFDNDGDQDIFNKIGGAFSGDLYHSVLFQNPGHGNRWITLKLEGASSNRSAIGARIRVVVKTAGGERTIHRTVGSGGSFGASPLRQEIGLGQAHSIERVEITWPTSGLVQSVKGLEMDRIYRVAEGDSSIVLWDLKRLEMPPRGAVSAPHNHPPGTVSAAALNQNKN